MKNFYKEGEGKFIEEGAFVFAFAIIVVIITHNIIFWMRSLVLWGAQTGKHMSLKAVNNRPCKCPWHKKIKPKVNYYIAEISGALSSDNKGVPSSQEGTVASSSVSEKNAISEESSSVPGAIVSSFEAANDVCNVSKAKCDGVLPRGEGEECSVAVSSSPTSITSTSAQPSSFVVASVNSDESFATMGAVGKEGCGDSVRQISQRGR